MCHVSGHQAMRLAGGSDRCAGRVELWRNGRWGTVCDDLWDLRDADVACGQLSCGYALSVTGQGGPFPPGRGPVYLDDLNCTGNEDNLWSCPATEDEPDCGHKEDAGVTCSGHSHKHNHQKSLYSTTPQTLADFWIKPKFSHRIHSGPAEGSHTQKRMVGVSARLCKSKEQI